MSAQHLRPSTFGHNKNISLRFRQHDFSLRLSPSVAAPNQYTSILLRYLEGREFCGKSVLDVGCGSGPISVVSAKYLGAQTVCAIDKNHAAVGLTIENCKLNGCPNTVIGKDYDIRQGNWGQGFDVVLSNPPQIPTPENNRDDGASGGIDGLDIVRATIQFGKDALERSGEILMVAADFLDIRTIQTHAQALGFTVNLESEQVARMGRYTSQFVEHIERNGYQFNKDSIGPYFTLRILSIRR
jgi:methylase of polypeptide subunit release factors